MNAAVILDHIWNDFSDASLARDLEEMKLHRERFEREFEKASLVLVTNLFEQNLARRRVMATRIERTEKAIERSRERFETEGTW